MAKIRYRNGSNVITLLDSSKKLLWSGSNYMGDGQRITLAQKVSDQNSGICLVWSEYVDGKPAEYGFNTTFVPKGHVVDKPGVGLVCIGGISSLSAFMSKYLYVNDAWITGHGQNTDGEKTAASGVKVNNSRFVLRSVYGV